MDDIEEPEEKPSLVKPGHKAEGRKLKGEEASIPPVPERLLPERQSITYHSLATALLHLEEAQSSIPKTTEEGFKAVATLITDLADRTAIAELATAVRERLSGVNDVLAPMLQQMELATTKIRESTNSLAGTVEELRQESDGTAQRIVDAVTAQAPTPTTQGQEQHPTSKPARYPTYAAALAACATKPISLQSSTLARCDLRARQILIDKTPAAPDHRMARLSEPDILDRANRAVGEMEWEDDQEKPRAVGVQRLPSDAFFLELQTEETAELLQTRQTATSFLSKFSSDSIIKPNNYSIIAEFVPIRFNPESRAELEGVETGNSLEQDDIVSA
ncbi:hypothetical protein JB92DRAFT_3110585 [Gautieria morchelliformis]|nr:hypothetical protein JB92DRAFT_3110585 [Gautieria morchelliformis]